MSDFENRLRDALGAGAADAPDAVGLADAARSRARSRRRTTVAVSALAVLALVAVPAGVFALRDSGQSSPGFAQHVTETPEGAVPDGWRVETWHDLEIQVPEDWGYGAQTRCSGGDQQGTPVVERPHAVIELRDCAPSRGYGVSFFNISRAPHPPHPTGKATQPVGSDIPPGAWTGVTSLDDGAAVMVIAPTQDLAQRILDSAHKVEGVDSNGCPPELSSGTPEVESGRMAVCRYTGDDGRLEQSESLSAVDADAARAAIEAAPSRAGQRGPGPCRDARTPGWTVVLRDARVQASVRFGTGCYWDDGVRIEGDNDERDLSIDVLRWALSPGWFGSVDESVPLPPELRH